VAGDYPVTRELAEAAGVVVVETLEELEDVVRLLALLRDHPRLSAARRLGAISNAGFECVAVADHSGPFSLATWSETTRQGLQELLADKGLADLVAPTNPLDVTPMADDEAFARAARLVLEDEGVEVGVVGCVPLTGALATLEAGRREGEDRSDLGSVLCRLAALRREVRKPWVAVVDAGELYDPFARGLEAAAIPTFRTMDRALRALARLLVRP
jgi:acyl-CoA synthetase (NDP forming)